MIFNSMNLFQFEKYYDILRGLDYEQSLLFAEVRCASEKKRQEKKLVLARRGELWKWAYFSCA